MIRYYADRLITEKTDISTVLPHSLLTSRNTTRGIIMKHIKLTQGKVALVDDEDFERINQFKWCADFINKKYWYAVRTIRKGKRKMNKQNLIIMHREILKLQKGDGKEIDHINHNGLDNRRCNLRVCSHAENQHNRKSNKGSIYKGVRWYKLSQKWIARIGFNNKKKHIGCFNTSKQAAKAYDNAAKKYFGKYAYLNFPEKE